MNAWAELLALLKRLSDARIHYRLSQFREDSIAVEVAVPGERWEIEYMADGAIEIERFRSDGRIRDQSALDELFERFSE